MEVAPDLDRASGISETVDHGHHCIGPDIGDGGKGKGHQAAAELDEDQSRASARAASYGREQLHSQSLVLLSG